MAEKSDETKNSNAQVSSSGAATSTKVESHGKTEGQDQTAQNENLPLSEADLEKVIEEADPDFAKNLADVQIDIKDIALDLIDLDSVYYDESPKTFKEQLKLAKYRLRQIALGWYASQEAQIHLFFTEDLPHFFHESLNKLKALTHTAKDSLNKLSHLDKSQKIKLAVFISLSLATIGYAFIAYKKNLFESKDQLFLASLDGLADHVYIVDDNAEWESFYESIRIAQNIVTTPKMRVNIKRSRSSGDNPMAAFDLYIEGIGPEVVVEIKDREYEFKDIIQRVVEEMNYDQLEGVDGKKLLLERVRREINLALTQGKIRRVMFKTFILKP